MSIKQTDALKLALEALLEVNYDQAYAKEVAAIREALAEQPEYRAVKTWHEGKPVYVAEQPAQQQEPVTVLPDGSAFAVMSYPLPKEHWLYADRQYNDGEYEPVELGKPILTHELRDAVVSAVRYAIRGATNCGKEVDFDPDALVQNAVYALCGPFTSPPASKPLTDEQQQADRALFQAQTAAIALTKQLEIYEAALESIIMMQPESLEATKAKQALAQVRGVEL